MSDQGMFIGELARLTGATPKAIRLYESMGLLGTVRRRGSYRLYSDKDCQRIQVIREAQRLGFKLSELSAVLLPAGSELDWQVLVRQLEARQAGLRKEVQRLNYLHGEIEAIKVEIGRCLGGGSITSIDHCSTLAKTAP